MSNYWAYHATRDIPNQDRELQELYYINIDGTVSITYLSDSLAGSITVEPKMIDYIENKLSPRDIAFLKEKGKL